MNANVKRLLDDLESYAGELQDRDLLAIHDELRAELEKPAALWPDGVAEAAAEVVSASVFNPESRTFKSLDKRILWLQSLWQDRYGPLSPKQHEYMRDLMIAAIRSGAKDAGDDKRKLYSYIQRNLSQAANHEVVDAGFKKRAETMSVEQVRGLFFPESSRE